MDTTAFEQFLATDVAGRLTRGELEQARVWRFRAPPTVHDYVRLASVGLDGAARSSGETAPVSLDRGNR